MTRLCTNPQLPDAIRYKAASTLYGWAAAEGAARGFEKIITYTMAEAETGMSLRYARWKPEHRTRPKSWNSRSRPRVDKAPVVARIRWGKDLGKLRMNEGGKA